MTKAKNKTIVMPVGEKAGKKVSLPIAQADEILNVFGAHKETVNAAPDASVEVADLTAQLSAVTAERDALKEELEELTKPDGGGDDS